MCLYFNLSSNFLRMCILRVTQQSNKHLDKILNIDEFVRRIFFVIHSNDPVARALTLRYSLTLIYWKFCVSYFVKVDSYWTFQPEPAFWPKNVYTLVNFDINNFTSMQCITDDIAFHRCIYDYWEHTFTDSFLAISFGRQMTWVMTLIHKTWSTHKISKLVWMWL